MRFLACCLLLITLCACANESAQQREDLSAFADRWDATTKLVTDQVTGILKALEEAQQLSEALDTLSGTVPPALKEDLQRQIKSLGQASEASFEFVNKWQEGAARLNTLKEKKPKHISAASLLELQQLEQQGRERAQEWQTQLEAANTTFEQAKQQLAN